MNEEDCHDQVNQMIGASEVQICTRRRNNVDEIGVGMCQKKIDADINWMFEKKILY